VIIALRAFEDLSAERCSVEDCLDMTQIARDADFEHEVSGGVATARKHRILVLSPRDPYPVLGGDRVRIHRIARELAQHHELTLLTFCESARERDAPPPNDGVFTRVCRVVLPRWRSWLNVLAALPTREPLQVAYYRSGAFRAAVDALAPTHDAVLAHLVRTANYACGLKPLRLLEMTDAISMNMQRVVTACAGSFDPRRLLYAIEAGRLATHERRIARAFDLVTLTSPVDKAFLFGTAGRTDVHTMVVANGVDPTDFNPPPQADRHAGEIAFVGSLNSLQNFDAVWFFARAVLPLIRARFPGAVLRIIGPVPPRAARRLARLAGVRVEGVVPCLPRALATARVGVCPIRAGAGIKNKVLDYFAGRLAVVCSPMGLEGIDARVDKHLLLASTPEEWATQVVRLLHDAPLAQRLADAGRELARQKYRWEGRARPLLHRLDYLFAQRAAEPDDSAFAAAAVTDKTLTEATVDAALAETAL
jgi:glycosyltransferase involved in cell wall biosynthesis